MNWSKQQDNTEKQLFLENLYKTYYDKVYIKINSMCFSKNPHDIEDCVSQTFLVALKKYDILKIHPNPKAYLLKTASNIVNNFNTTYSRNILKQQDINDISIPSMEERVENDIIEQKIINQEIYTKIMNNLNKEQQQLYFLRFVENMSYENIAELFGVSNSTIRMRISRLKLCIINEIQKILK